MEILLLIIGLVIGFFIGEGLALFKIRQIMLRVAERNGIDLTKEMQHIAEVGEIDEPEETIVYRLEIEKINDILYLYDRGNDSFICQAKNIEELALLSKNYKNIHVATVIHDDKLFIFQDGNAQEYTK